MRIETPSFNPLVKFFELIPEEGIKLTRDNLERIGSLFNTGGIIAETYREVIVILLQFQEWYGLISVNTDENGSYILRKTNG